ncbi:MAG: InlB B-repeat-containing protein, partial [Eubacteriales bacterium]
MKKRMVMALFALLCICACLFTFAACKDEETPPADTGSNGSGSNDTAHTHAYATTWSSDSENHWHACTGSGCDGKSDLAAHVYDNADDATCNVCGYERAVVPTVKTYTITFVTNGGSPVAQIEAEAGDEITVPAAPTKSGERFIGWYE